MALWHHYSRLEAEIRALTENYIPNYVAMPESRDPKLPRGVAFSRHQIEHLRVMALTISNAYTEETGGRSALKKVLSSGKFEERRKRALAALENLQSYFPESSPDYDFVAERIAEVKGEKKSPETSVAIV